MSSPARRKKGRGVAVAGAPLKQKQDAADVSLERRKAAFNLFCKLDCDKDSALLAWELERYLGYLLGAKFSPTFDVVLPGPDHGIHLRTDRSLRIVVDAKDDRSVSSHFPSIMPGMEVLRCNGIDLGKGKSGLRMFSDMMADLNSEDIVSFTLANPVHIVSDSDCWLDLDVFGNKRCIELPRGVAYSQEEFASVVQNAARQAHPGVLDDFSCIADLDSEIFSVTAGGLPLQLLFASGEHASQSCWMHLGFEEGKDTYASEAVRSSKWSAGAVPRKTDEAELHVRHEALKQFAEDLAKAFDADGDAQCSLDFEEFFLLYEEYFSPERLGSLREKVVVGYLTEEEAAAYEKEQEAMVRANQRLLEMHEMRHHVKVRQQQQFVDQMEAGHLIRDDTTNLAMRVPRAKGTSRIGSSISSSLKSVSENVAQMLGVDVRELLHRRAGLDELRVKQKAKKQSQLRTRAQRDADLIEAVRSAQKQRAQEESWAAKARLNELSKLGLEALGASSSLGDPAASSHPAFLGYFAIKREESTEWDPEFLSPTYFGARFQALHSSAGKSLSNMRSLRSSIEYLSSDEVLALPSRSWQSYPCIPVNKGAVKQHLPSWGVRYDGGELIHPSCTGRLFLSGEGRESPEMISPVFVGYELTQKPDAPEGFGRSGKSSQNPWAGFRDAVQAGAPCPVCLVHKPGCPMCWEYPAGNTPVDFEYTGPSASSSGVKLQNQPALHTNLTTASSLRLYRSICQNVVHFLVKTLPCGQTNRVSCFNEWPVQVLYELFRSTSAEGCERETFLFMPTVFGVFSLDNEDLPETDSSLGVKTCLVPLSRYNLSIRGSSRVCLLHTTFFSETKTQENVRRFLHNELVIADKYSTGILKHLVCCPESPESDPVQKALVTLLEDRIQREIDVEQMEKADEEQKLQNLLQETELARKAQAVALKKALHEKRQGQKQMKKLGAMTNRPHLPALST